MIISILTCLFLLILIFVFNDNLLLLFSSNLIVLFFLSLYNEKYFVTTYIIYLFTYKFLISYQNIDPVFELLPVIVNFLLIPSILLTKRNIKIHNNGLVRKIILPLIMILSTILFSSLYNGINFFELIRWYAWILNPICLMLYIYYSHIEKNDLLKIIKNVFLLIIIVQIPLILLQSISGSLLNISSSADTFTGTLGSSGTAFLALLCCILFYYVSYDAIKNKNYFYFVFTALVVLFFSIIADIVFAIVVCLFFPLLIIIFRKFFNLSFSLNRISLLFVFLLTVIFSFSVPRVLEVGNLLNQQDLSFNTNRFNVQDLTEYSNMVYMGENGGIRFGRSLGLVYSFYTIFQSDFQRQILGYGAGSTRSEESSTQFSGPPKFRPVPQTNFFGIDTIVIEFGILGILVFFYFFRVLYLQTLNRYNNKKLPQIYLMILFLYFIFGLVYDGGWFFNPSKNGIFWIITGTIFSYLDQDDYNKNND